MVRRNPKTRPELWHWAPLFAALGDHTRLRILSRLGNQGPASITQLSAGFDITRQAVTKHLRVLQSSGLVRCSRHGRERIWRLEQRRMQEARHYLQLISQQWDNALAKLRDFVE